MKATTLLLWAAVAAAYLVPSHLFAATAAYWRHEEATPVGAIVPGGETGTDVILDSSGNGNNMRTFRSTTAPFTAATYSSTVSPLALRSGLPNTKSLDFGPSPAFGTEDGGGLNDDNFTNAKPIHTQLFTEQTIELSFRMNDVPENAYQAVFGKDGKPLGDDVGEPDLPIPPFKMLIRGDAFPGPADTPRPGTGAANQLFIEWIDGDGDVHYMASGETVVADQWLHIAVTRTATDAELWVAGETGDYELKDAISGGDFAGAFGEIEIFEPLGYSIGRGMFGNGPSDWADAIIDEVRISDTALTPEEFLFVTVDAPAEDADFDGDGDVDGQDFLTWQRGLGLTGTGTLMTGDANDDGNVNGEDLAIWRQQFGPGAPVAAVPEPGTAALCLIGLAALLGRRSRSARQSD